MIEETPKEPCVVGVGQKVFDEMLEESFNELITVETGSSMSDATVEEVGLC
ncbi:UNVERIFIED_CONTAM: hypothetical protein Slati_0845000 [Sesamum latifolium]|uniref:Uncharacterized protein n=1 Tax=Sesamum latifolium TaxID=2727402 RepID=A0AAW2XMH5_9LAMI